MQNKEENTHGFCRSSDREYSHYMLFIILCGERIITLIILWRTVYCIT